MRLSWWDSQFVSGDFFATLGAAGIARPNSYAIGRHTRRGARRCGSHHQSSAVAAAFQLFNDVVGTRVMLERTPVTIVGVAPRTFLGLEIGRAFDVLLPIHASPLILTGQGASLDRDMEWLRIMLRLNRAQSVESATARMRTAQNAIRAAAMPRKPQESFLCFRALRARACGYRFVIVEKSVSTYAADLICDRPCGAARSVFEHCESMFTRGVGRMRDTSVRLSLGATRWQLMKPLLLESIVLACAAAVLPSCLRYGQAVGLSLVYPTPKRRSY